MKDNDEKRITIRLSKEMMLTLKQIMIAENKSQSDVVRELLHAGLVSKGYEKNENYLYQLIQQALAEELKGPVERLAAISAKSAQIAGASFFMNIFASTLRIPERDKYQIMEAVTTAREEGIQFLKLRGDDLTIDEFLQRGAKNIVPGEYDV